jgi:hypothetical protein
MVSVCRWLGAMWLVYMIVNRTTGTSIEIVSVTGSIDYSLVYNVIVFAYLKK